MSYPMNHDYEQDGQRPRASMKIIVSAVVVSAIVIAGVILALVNLLGGGKEEAAPVAASPSSSPAAPTTASPQASVCGLTPVEMSGTVTVPPVATWTLVGTIAAPSVKGQGPGVVDTDGYRSCYAHTPTGALLAAANYTAIGSTPSLRAKFNDRAPVPGPGRDALLRKGVQGSNNTTTRIQIAGFRVLSYDGHQASIDLAFKTSNGAIGGAVLPLQWANGDWKIRLGDDGSDLSQVAQIQDLNGYILWSGV